MDELPSLLYQDDSVLVVQKPAGMPSVSLRADEVGTLAAWLLERVPAQRQLLRGGLEAGLCHRLDNETSGLLVAARSQEAYEVLREGFSDGSIEKRYLGLVLGRTPPYRLLERPIAHHPSRKNRMVVCETQKRAEELKGREARTELWTRQRFQLGVPGKGDLELSLLELRLWTGVRHQLRVHLAGEGHPLLGDRLYQNARQRLRDPGLLPGYFLHAWHLGFPHPCSGERLELESPLPSRLQKVLDRLELSPWIH